AVNGIRGAYLALGGGDRAVGWGYLGDAFLRLAGLSVNAIQWLRKPRCFIAGTPVHTENGTKPIETLCEGEKVWAFDREHGKWVLGEITKTVALESELLT